VKGISVATILGIKCEEEEYKMREKEVKTNTKRKRTIYRNHAQYCKIHTIFRIIGQKRFAEG
jgi:hypothetical protein